MSAFDGFETKGLAAAAPVGTPADIHIHPRLLSGYARQARTSIAQFDAGLLDMLKSLADVMVQHHLAEDHPFAIRLRLAVRLIEEGLAVVDPISTNGMQIRASATTLIEEISSCLQTMRAQNGPGSLKR